MKKIDIIRNSNDLISDITIVGVELEKIKNVLLDLLYDKNFMNKGSYFQKYDLVISIKKMGRGNIISFNYLKNGSSLNALGMDMLLTRPPVKRESEYNKLSYMEYKLIEYITNSIYQTLSFEKLQKNQKTTNGDTNNKIKNPEKPQTDKDNRILKNYYLKSFYHKGKIKRGNIIYRGSDVWDVESEGKIFQMFSFELFDYKHGITPPFSEKYLKDRAVELVGTRNSRGVFNILKKLDKYYPNVRCPICVNGQ